MRARAASGGLGPVDSRHARDYRSYLKKDDEEKEQEEEEGEGEGKKS